MKTIIFIFFFFLSKTHAVPTGKVVDLDGKVIYSNRLLELKHILAEDGLLTVSRGASVKIHVSFWRGYFIFSENSSLSIKFWKKGERREYNLNNGRCRWTDDKGLDKKGKDIKEIKGRNIHTTNAIVKILRGDVVVDYDKILKETQVLVLIRSSDVAISKRPQ